MKKILLSDLDLSDAQLSKEEKRKLTGGCPTICDCPWGYEFIYQPYCHGSCVQEEPAC